MPTVTVTIYPKCETVVERADHPKGRKRERPCGLEGARYLIVGGMGTVEQNLCQAHKRQAEKAHEDWTFHELKRAIKREEREVGITGVGTGTVQPRVKPVYGVVDDDIPF